MVVFRALGWLLMAMTVATAVQNGLTWWSEGAFRFLTLGDVWAHFDYGSLLATQAFLTRHVSAGVWTWSMLPLLHVPALPVFLILGLFCLWRGQSNGEGRRRRRSADFAVGSRRPKRRRSRGLS
jgi:hypothetical protein